jgi:predicted Zn-dependent protease
MQTALADPKRARPLQVMGIRRKDLRSADDAVKALRATTLAGSGKAALKELDEALEAARGADPQWHTDPLLATLQAHTQAMKKPSVFYLGVAGVDVFMDRSNFAFGTALVGAGYGVMSYRRFTAEFSSEPPDSGRLLVRASKQALSSIGFMLGVDRCSSPTCARSYSRNLAEHDAKSARPCDACRRSIALALGQSEPSAVP